MTAGRPVHYMQAVTFAHEPEPGVSLPQRHRIVSLLIAVAAVFAAVVLPGGVAEPAAAAQDAPISGTLEIEVRGTGAAPFGIASSITTGVGLGYNLARLQSFEPPTEIAEHRVTLSGRRMFA